MTEIVVSLNNAVKDNEIQEQRLKNIREWFSSKLSRFKCTKPEITTKDEVEMDTNQSSYVELISNNP